MEQFDFANQLLDQSKDLFWVINDQYFLVYANKSYQNVMMQTRGVASPLNESVFVDGFGEDSFEKWKAFYDRALKGELFEIEEHFYHPETQEIQFRQNSFEPLFDNKNKVYAVSCQSKDVTRIVKQRSEANQMMDSSLDVFCTINKEGNFVYVSAAASSHWGYQPQELLNTPFEDLVVEEDLIKTRDIASTILSGIAVTTFENRYKKKNGELAYNLWSVSWDDKTQLMYCVARDAKEKIEKDKIIHLSEQRYRALVQEGSDMVTILDAAGNYKFVSPTNQVVLGIDPEDYIGKNAFQFIHPEDEERTLASLKKITNTKKVIVEPYRFLNYKKEWRWIETVLTNMLDNPAVNGIVSNSRDITEKIKQNELIKLSEQRFKSLVQEGSDLISIIDIEGNYTYVSPTSTSILGLDPQAFIGTNAFQLIHPDDAERTLKSLQRIATENKVTVEPFRFQNNKEEWRWIETVLTNMLDNPAINGIVANSRDITDKIKQEELIQQSEQRFKALVQDGSDMISIVDAEGKYIYTSPTTTAILGITPEEFQGKTIFDFIHPDDAERCIVYMQKIATEKKVFVPPFRLKDAQNNWRWIETVLTNMLDNPAVNGLVANSRDITEAVNAQKQIESTEQFNRTVLESSPDCFKILDKAGRIQYMNYNGLCHMEIDDFSTIKNKDWHTLWGTENELLVKNALDKALNGQVAQFTAYCPTAKGTPKWWDVLVSSVGKPGEPIDQIISVSRDVTKQKEKEQQLKLLTSVITNTNDAVVITEAEPFDFPGPKIIYVNEAFTRMTGYTAEEVIGATPRILQGENTDKKELQKLSEAIRKWEPCEITVVNYKKNGEEFWCNFNVKPVADKKGRYTHWIAIERDVTEQKNKEREKELIAQISTAFNQENDFRRATKQLCKTVKEFGKFDLAEVWVPNIEKTEIHLISHCINDTTVEKFYDKTYAQTILNKGEGLAGKVWGTATLLHWDYETMQHEFLRKDAAEEIGLKSFLGIPLIHNDEVIGVLQIGTKREYNHLVKYSKLFNKLEKFIGSEFYRKKLENDLAHLLDSVPDLICILDFEGKFLKINKAGSKLLGYSEAEILYQSFDRFLHPADKNYAFSDVLHGNPGENTSTFENRFYTKEGTIISLQWNCNTALEEGYIYATAKNITVEKKLRELNQQTRLLTKIGSWEVDLTKQTLFWSDEVHQMHETDPNTFELDLETGINFYREDFRQIIQSQIENCISSGEPFDYEAVLITSTKKELWARVIGNAEFVDGKCIRLYGSFQDISAIKETENRLVALSENLPGIVYQYLIKPDGTDSLQYVSKGVEEIWGFTAEQVIENNNLVWDQIKLGGDYKIIEESITNSIKTRSKWSTKIKYVMPTGEIKTHIGHGIPTFLTDGTILYNSIILDITKEAKNEELLKQTSEIARLGSWEMDLLNQTTDNMYWSPVVWDILELDDNYNPTLTGGIELNIGESRTRIEHAINRLIQDGIEFEEEILMRTGKGNERWFKSTGKSIRVNHLCTKIYGSFQDINERKQAELKLIESEQEYRTLASQLQLEQTHLANAQKVAKIGSWETNLVDFTVSWSDETYRIFGMDNDGSKMTHEKFLSNVHPLDREKVDKALGDSLSDTSKRNHFIEHRILTKDGVEKIVEERWLVNFETNGSLLNAVGSCQDITERKKTEEDRNNLRNTIENSINEIYIFDDKTYKFIYVNKGAIQNLGYAENEILKLTPLDIKPDFTLETFKDLVKPLVNKEKNKIIFFTSHQRKNGTLYPAEIHLQLATVGNETRFVAIILDITERKKAEKEALSVFEEKNRILERITEAFVSLDTNWCYTYMNNKAGEIFNTDPEAIVGKHIWTEFPEGLNQPFHFAYEKAMETQEYCYMEEYYAPFDMWFENHIYPSPDGLSIFFRDITARKRIEEQLRKSNERFEKVTEATNDAIWDWDIVNNTFFRSKAIERFFGGTTLQTLVGTDLWQHRFHEEDLEKIQESVNEALTNPTVNRWEFEYRIYNDTREIIYIIDRGLIIRDEKGKATRMVGAMTDITHQKQLTIQLYELNQSLKLHTEELERSNEELEQFAFVASHDLQEPLRMISSFMELLKRKYGDLLDEKGHQYIDFATDGSKRMKKIILDLLDYSRAGKSTDEKENVDLNEIMIDYRVLRKNVIKNKAVTIEVKTLPTVLSYKAAVIQIFHCLLDNAIKYSKEDNPPIIVVDTIEKAKEWEFTIKDNGIGIDPQFFTKIFVIFQRLHNNKDYEGTGIGLSIVKRQVEFLGGKIWVESSVGKGTIFHFTLPKKLS